MFSPCSRRVLAVFSPCSRRVPAVFSPCDSKYDNNYNKMSIKVKSMFNKIPIFKPKLLTISFVRRNIYEELYINTRYGVSWDKLPDASV